MDVCIRRARLDDVDVLTDISFFSKAVWGYDADFMEQCREELTLTPEYVLSREVHVAELGEQLVGFYGLTVDGSSAVLDYLYVVPKFVKQGLGRKLWNHITENAKGKGVHLISIDADPHAENFYRIMGAELVGTTPSGSIPGRMLPLMRITLNGVY